MKSILLLTVLSAVSVLGCKSGDKKAAPESSGLEMSSSSAACKKAMKCCEHVAKGDTGSVTPEDLNLKCSGVALAKTDTDCDLFRQGYAASLEGKSKPVPPECK